MDMLLNRVLNEYPQAIVFAGHSHYPVGDPRSIHQGANPDSAHKNYDIDDNAELSLAGWR